MAELNEIKLETKKDDRDAVLDNFRGFVIFVVTVWTCVFVYQQHLSPLWAIHTDHAFHYGLLKNPVAFSFMDYGLPMFIMAAGFAQKLSYDKALLNHTAKQINSQAINRTLKLFAIAFLFNIANVLFQIPNFIQARPSVYLRIWNMFASLGGAYIVSHIFIKYKAKIRLIASGALVALYFVLYFALPIVRQTPTVFPEFQYGGIFGVLLFGALQLVMTVAGEWYLNKQNKKFYILMGSLVLASLPTIALSIVNNMVAPITNNFAAMFLLDYFHFKVGYILVAMAFDSVAFLVIRGISRLIGDRPIPVLNTMGKSSLFFFFVASALIMSVEFVPPFPQIWVGRLVVGLVVTAISCSLAIVFSKKNIVIKI